MHSSKPTPVGASVGNRNAFVVVAVGFGCALLFLIAACSTPHGKTRQSRASANVMPSGEWSGVPNGDLVPTPFTTNNSQNPTRNIPALDSESQDALRAFTAFVQKFRAAPQNAEWKKCYKAPDPEVGWCDAGTIFTTIRAEQGPSPQQFIFSVRYWSNDTKSFEFQVDDLKGDLSCSFFSAVELRHWQEGQNPPATWRRCRGTTGPFDGLEIVTASRDPIRPEIASGVRIHSTPYYGRLTDPQLRRSLAP